MTFSLRLTLQARLSEEAQAHNDGASSRPFPYNYTLHSCDPAIMDTSISV